MLTVPAELVPLIGAFALLFSTPVWEHAHVLLVGAMLATGKRTVTARLRGDGVEPGEGFRSRSPRLKSGTLVAADRQSPLATDVAHLLRSGG